MSQEGMVVSWPDVKDPGIMGIVKMKLRVKFVSLDICSGRYNVWWRKDRKQNQGGGVMILLRKVEEIRCREVFAKVKQVEIKWEGKQKRKN